MSMPDAIDDKIKRLISLIGTDEGFYILALHSFVEYYLREVKKLGNELSFPELTWQFRAELLEQYGDTFIDGLSSLRQLGKQHYLTNKVRHSFSEISTEEARAATSMFLRFCSLAGINSAVQLKLFNEHLKIWENKETIIEQNIIITSLQKELGELKKRNSNLSSKLDSYRDLTAQLGHLKHELAAKEIEIETVRKTAGDKGQKADELRQERFNLKEQINTLLKEKDRYHDLQTYLDYLGRLTVYTRSRLDYERMIAQLSPEQKSIVDSVSFDRDFLIRGTAGTGKSLVLISAMKRIMSQGRLDFFAENPIIFITFTKTLVKYSRFTALLMKLDIPPVLFSTVDTLVYDNLKKIDEEFLYDFNITDEFLQTITIPPFMKTAELTAELEEFLLGRLIKKDEYIRKHIPREGMIKPLNREQRTLIWNIRDGYIDYMNSKHRYSLNYGRLRLSKLMSEGREKAPVKGLQTVFIDEVQDLNPAALAAVKSITNGPLIMAGDFQQSLYMTQNPFIRAGIDIRGTTKILKTNFRNTRQILEKADSFRDAGGSPEQHEVISFREGPPSELFIADNADAIKIMLFERVSLFQNELGYDPENICILVPRNKYIIELEKIFKEADMASVKINSDEFDFINRGSLNISTLHSCKGLDFPVVLLYLPELIRHEKYSESQTEQLLRNLIYTGMTRAMDHLNVFITESEDPVIKDIAAVYSKG